MLTYRTWIVVVAVSIVGGLLLTVGLIQAFQVTTFSKESRNNQRILDELHDGKQSDSQFVIGDDGVQIVIMGDSIAKGTGDETDRGLTSGIEDYMKEMGEKVEVINTAINGLVSQELREIVESEQITNLIEKADMIIISIGGNDLRRMMGRPGGTFAVDDAVFNETKTSYLENLTFILNHIREQNADAQLLFIGLYNPFGEDVLNLIAIDDSYIEYLQEWNFETQKIIDQDPNGVYVPTYDLFKWNMDRFMSFDRIHPSGDGYRAIAERLASYIHIDKEED